MLVSLCVCVCVSTVSQITTCVITSDLAYCSRQGYGYCEGKAKLGAILWATVIVSRDYPPSARQQQHPPLLHRRQAAFTSVHISQFTG